MNKPRSAQELWPVRGIYFLLAGDTVMYVGKATNVYARLAEHTTFPSKLVTSYRFLPVPCGDLDVEERRWIRELKPIYNIACNGPGARDRLNKFLKTQVLESAHPSL